MNSHTCSLCQVLFWKACCVPKVKQGCSKGNPEQRSRCAIFSGWMGGEKLARICGRRGPLPQGSKKKKERKPPTSVWNVHGEARYWPSIVTPRNGLFFFSFFVLFFISLVVWCRNAISVSCIMSCVCVCFHGVGVCAFARFSFYPC